VDDLESHIIVNVSSTLTNTTIWFVAALSFIVDVRSDGRTHGRTFLPALLGHLSRDDLKTDRHKLDWNLQRYPDPLAGFQGADLQSGRGRMRGEKKGRGNGWRGTWRSCTLTIFGTVTDATSGTFRQCVGGPSQCCNVVDQMQL